MARGIRAYLGLLLGSALCALAADPPDPNGKPGPGGADNVYDYIVVGSGPGGAPVAVNLARAGYSVLILEAGDDQSDDPSTHALALNVPKPTNRWDFFVKLYSNETQTLRNNHLTWKRADGTLWVGSGRDAPADAKLLGVHYPRGATLGGSSTINAAGAVLPSASDWDSIGALTGDPSWSNAKFREILKRIEKNLYLPQGTPGHGFDGYLPIAGNDGTVWERQPDLVDVFKSMVSSVGDDPADVIKMVQRDINSDSPTRDTTQGLFGLPFHANATFGRFSARDLIRATLAARNPNGDPQHPLTLRTNALATRVLFDKPRKGKPPRATGVEFLSGASLYRADPRNSPSNTGTKHTATARREVILSAGVFNTPQLLLLSGIGPPSHLAEHKIPLLVPLPAVGTRLQDNHELPLIGIARRPLASIPVPSDPPCTFGAPSDPCLTAFTTTHSGPYARAGLNSNAFLLRTNHSPSAETDVLLFTFPNAAFRGFWPAEANASSIPPEPPGTVSMSMVKLHPQSPRAGAGAETDLGAFADAAAWARRVYAGVAGPVGPVRGVEPPCVSEGVDGGCSRAADELWVRDRVFGHHAVGTCAIGEVVDGRFRVRGTEGLRVVDGSVFPMVPGAFPVLATFLVGEKASEELLADARGVKRGR
ncbi:hypothetical protein B0T18DRAFT_370890 [Schizothecium vesticola]|uniref:Alcohol oxidase n=1 Tax=Schizothecium vesticola TaxID=314040 RepID=A0AA40K247_9PEZI|nr:hypothetical protein B0T18DRAFT_370890 [Schizothecium vesticola]